MTQAKSHWPCTLGPYNSLPGDGTYTYLTRHFLTRHNKQRLFHHSHTSYLDAYALLSTLVPQGMYIICLLSPSVSKTLKAKCPLKFIALNSFFTLFLAPGWLSLYFFSANSREDFPFSVFKVIQMSLFFTHGPLFGPTPFLLNSHACISVYQPLEVSSNWEKVLVANIHWLSPFCFPLPGSLFIDLCVFVTNLNRDNLFPKWSDSCVCAYSGFLFCFVFLLHLSISNTYEQMELFLNTVAEFSLTDTSPHILVN